MKDKISMPLIEAMLQYKSEDVYPLHTPGHKGGRGMQRLLRQELGASVQMDVSLMSELDDIHEPATYIKEAQELAAQTYGSDACFWAVNGTSQAIHAMLLTALNPGEKLLLPRNAHRSVAGGLVLGGIEAVYLQPEYQPEFGIQMQVTVQQIEAALAQDSKIKAVLLTSPNYYGVAADVQAIADCCHAHNAVLLVDEAHGPHLGFSELLPPSALQCGADACAQSTHKILGAMTQCSMLHVQGARLDLQRAADVMSLLTTTSPNYLLMASLDAARAQVQAYGGEMAAAAVQAAAKLRRLCASYSGLCVMEAADCGGLQLDSTKVTVNFAAWGYTGVEVGELFREARVAVELVDAYNVLFLVTYADVTTDYDEALARIAAVLDKMQAQKRAPLQLAAAAQVPQTQAVLPLRDVFYRAKKAVPLAQAAGKICGEQVSFYPPGIPVLLPGELVTEEIIAYCRAQKELGLPVSGPADSSLKTIRVIAD
ncbi:aminotransferase class I/II-fold pyridoxal phosphate-dependent enzyme [uncultured Phascolarctobacterium sp.]|uniref:aminotransferase class I/II-fold pyridoxal phosphate-dependent enzyme n=1 Tax=uncultured Phascolarctobacterium sp. TaxID=512296 RepID=UPI0025CCEB7B|nr:aminotransferase class I/II-fold pyridoxal phosphate-dependent enzyme [uncultured Phascolarctobacterium sp.]